MPSDAPSPAGSRPLLRAAGLGLCAGLFIGGLLLVFLGMRGWLVPPDCEGLFKPECELLQDTALHISRVQLLCGGALVALGLAIGVLLRPAFAPQKPEDP
jgi:hypothetical protein